MARLASQEKMGYYPTPPEVVEQIKKVLTIPEGAKLIDTCCGEGDALAMIAEDTGAVTYGCELDRERYMAAKEKLNHILWCDSLNELICSKKAFDLLFLNPPYDYDEGDDERKSERLELLFLKKHFPLLRDRGVLIFIIPFSAAKKSLPYLMNRCTRVDLFVFPEKFYWQFKQVVLIAIKGKPKKADTERVAELEKRIKPLDAYDARYELESTSSCKTTYTLPCAGDDPVKFTCSRLDPDEVSKIIQRSPLWQKLESEIFTTQTLSHFRPLMPLREGHLAMLLASGLMNGEIKDGSERFVIKGSVKKVYDFKSQETETERKEITTDRYEINIKLLRLSKEPEIITIT